MVRPLRRGPGQSSGLIGPPRLPSAYCRVQRHPFERIATPFQVYSWTAPQAEHAMDCVRAEDAYTSRLGYEEHIPGQVPAAVPGSSLPSPVGPRLGSQCLWGCTGWQGAGLPPEVVGAQAELARPSWSLCRPGTGTRSCRPHGSCLGKTCLSDCCEKEPYSRCPWPLRPDLQPQAHLPPPHWFSVDKREAGSGLLWIRAFRDLPGHSATFCHPADTPSSFFWPL